MTETGSWFRQPGVADRRAAVLDRILRYLLLATVATLPISFVQPDPLWAVGGALFCVLMEVGALGLLRSGRHVAASWLVVSGISILLLVMAVKDDGITAPVLHALSVVIVVAALACGRRQAASVTGLCVCAVVVLWTQSDLEAGLPHVVQLVVVFVVTYALIRMTLGALEGQIEDAVASRDALGRATQFATDTLEQLGEAVFVVGASGVVQHGNPAAIELLQREVIGHRLDDVVAEGASFAELMAEGRVRLLEATLQVRKGEGVPVLLSASRLVGADRAPALVVCATDVRAQAQAQQELREAARLADEASRAKSRFLANMSHELRTPLNAILGYSELLAEDASPEDAADLQRIRASGQHLLSLINDVLDLSKIDAERMELTPEVVHLERFLREVADTARPVCALRGNTLRVELAPDLGLAWTDDLRLRQILLNLLSNAAKFTRDGLVTLSAERRRDERGALLWLQVCDTGVGMDEVQRAKLFRPFVQGHGRAYGGTGLGLVLCRRFAELMGGSIALHSTKGEGTRAVLMLPLATAPSEALQATG